MSARRVIRDEVTLAGAAYRRADFAAAAAPAMSGALDRMLAACHVGSLADGPDRIRRLAAGTLVAPRVILVPAREG